VTTADCNNGCLAVPDRGSVIPTPLGGLIEGLGGALVKTGLDTLTLSHAGNTYSGATDIVAGTLNLAAVGAAGTDRVQFAGYARLEIANAGLSGHVFGNVVGFFGNHDILGPDRSALPRWSHGHLSHGHRSPHHSQRPCHR